MLRLCTVILLVCSAFAQYHPRHRRPFPPFRPIGECPGNRRDIACTAIVRLDECTIRRPCAPGEICCRSECGNNVCRADGFIPTPPIFPEPHPHLRRCPRTGPRIDCRVAFFLNQCDRNSDCRRGYCCINECGARLCRDNILPSVPSCPAIPRDRSLCQIGIRDRCHNNSDCRRRQVCCRDRCGYNVCRRRSFIPPHIPYLQ